jgi:hypothetical protein
MIRKKVKLYCLRYYEEEEPEGTGETGEGRVADGFHRVPLSRRCDRRVSACRERFENRAGRGNSTTKYSTCLRRTLPDPAAPGNDEGKTSGFSSALASASLPPCFLDIKWLLESVIDVRCKNVLGQEQESGPRLQQTTVGSHHRYH